MALDVALKEWQSVCRLLAQGRQSVLLRKGGIQEGPGGFAIKHDAFALLPTRLHQDASMLRPEFRDAFEPGDDEPARFDVTHGCRVSDIHVVPSRDTLDRLSPFHPWGASYLDLRWNYRPERPLYLVVVRTFALSEALVVTNTYEVAGCRSWVPIADDVARTTFGEPVLAEAAHTAIQSAIVGMLET